MGISTIFATITSAVASGKALVEASKSLANAELKSMIATLANKLADLELEMAEAKTELSRLERENKDLKARVDAPGKPTIKWGCYQFEGEQGLFCPKCYEEKGKKYHTNRTDGGKAFQCSVCQTKFPTR